MQIDTVDRRAFADVDQVLAGGIGYPPRRGRASRVLLVQPAADLRG